MTCIAITRELNAGLGDCELTYQPRVAIDIPLAQRQHAQYQSALSSLGCEIVVVPTQPGLADSVFIEDTAFVLEEIAVMLRPGVASRQPEVAGVKSVLQQYRMLRAIEPPGTLDGGDLLCVGNTIFAGVSTRSNEEGIRQLENVVRELGFSVESVATTRCLHLKSAVSEVAPGTLLINPQWISSNTFGDFELIDVDRDESHGANALRIGRDVIYSTSYPRTTEKLQKQGINVTTVDVSEVQKAEGAVTCCSLILQGSD
jgi:dimethylargininase